MSTGLAILFTFGLLIVTIIVSALTQASVLPTIILVLASAIWAAIDAKKINIRHYQTGLGKSPTGIFLAVLLLWIVAFPWYLSIKGNIKNGISKLRDEYKGEAKPTPVDYGNNLSQLEKLAELKAKGILTEEEFQAHKAKLLPS